METQELKPCPFCGGEALLDSIEHHLYDNYYSYSVFCKRLKCDIEPDSYDSEEEAIEAWNKRVS